MNLGTGFVEIAVHGVVDKVSWEAGCLTLVSLLLLHPCDEEDLGNDDSPENAPDDQNAFESIDLYVIVSRGSNMWMARTYVLWSKFGVEDVRGNDVSNGVASVERGVVDGLLGLSGAVATHPGDEQGVDGVYESDQVVSDKEATLVIRGLGECDQQSDSNDDDGDEAEQERRLALEPVSQP